MTIQTNDPEDSSITKSPVRQKKVVRKPRKPQFLAIPQMNELGKRNGVPNEVQQQALYDMYMAMPKAHQAVVLALLNSPEFTSPGYGNSARYLKAVGRQQPTKVSLG